MTNFTLGINNCFAVKRWNRPSEWAEVIVNDLGLNSAQFSLDLLPPSFGMVAARDYILEAREVAITRGLDFNSVFTGLGAYAANLLLSESDKERNTAEQWYRDVIDLAVALNAPGAGGHIGALSVPASRDTVTRDALLADLRQRLLRLGDHAAAKGLKFLLFENLAVTREYGHSIAEAQALEKDLTPSAVPWTLCLDLGHPAALQTSTPSDDPVEWIHAEWMNTPVLQLQQSPRGSDRHASFTAANNAAGLVKRDEVLEALTEWDVPEIGLYLEVIPPHEADDDTVLRELVESVEFWRAGIGAIA